MIALARYKSPARSQNTNDEKGPGGRVQIFGQLRILHFGHDVGQASKLREPRIKDELIATHKAQSFSLLAPKYQESSTAEVARRQFD